MRHEQLLVKDSHRKVEIAAVWPAGVQIVPLPILDIDEAPAPVPTGPSPAAPDVPAAVGVMIAGCYVALLGTFALATIASGYSIYMITISALFLVAYFTVPWLFLRQEPKSGRRPSLDRFMRGGMETFTGHSTGRDALVQMLIVPVFLTLGVACMGIAAAIIM
jgi:hypothetical protein